MCVASPRKVILGCITKQVEQAMGSTLFLGLCISSCLQVPASCEFLSWLPLMKNCDKKEKENRQINNKIKPFLSKLFGP